MKWKMTPHANRIHCTRITIIIIAETDRLWIRHSAYFGSRANGLGVFLLFAKTFNQNWVYDVDWTGLLSNPFRSNRSRFDQKRQQNGSKIHSNAFHIVARSSHHSQSQFTKRMWGRQTMTTNKSQINITRSERLVEPSSDWHESNQWACLSHISLSPGNEWFAVSFWFSFRFYFEVRVGITVSLPLSLVTSVVIELHWHRVCHTLAFGNQTEVITLSIHQDDQGRSHCSSSNSIQTQWCRVWLCRLLAFSHA